MQTPFVYKKYKFIVLLVLTSLTQSLLAQIVYKDVVIDTTITGFKTAVNFKGTQVFTKNGSSDIKTFNPTAFSVTVVSDHTETDIKKQFDQLIDLGKRNGYQVTNLIKKDTVIQGYKAHYVSYKDILKEENYENRIYNGYYVKDNTIIIFTSGDLDKGKYVEAFKKTFYGLKF